MNYLKFEDPELFKDEPNRDIPSKTGKIESIHISDKLKEVGGLVGSNLFLGTFDQVGELTARKNRDPSSDLYKTAGCYFRPNYERGMLMYSLVKKYKPDNFLEIGFGRGYVTMCVAMAMCENGKGTITTVDPHLDEDHINRLQAYYPNEWFGRIKYVQSSSKDFFNSQEVADSYGIIFIDGDHRYEAVLDDWNSSKHLFEHVLVFDDYHLPEVNQKDIEVANVVDNLEDEYSKELILSDRLIFLDDRGTSELPKYGMAYITKQ